MSDALLGILTWAFLIAFAVMIVHLTLTAIVGLFAHPNLPDLITAIGGVCFLGQWALNHISARENS